MHDIAMGYRDKLSLISSFDITKQIILLGVKMLSVLFKFLQYLVKAWCEGATWWIAILYSIVQWEADIALVLVSAPLG